LPESVALLRAAISIAPQAPVPVPLITRIFTRENAETYLRDAVR
jgi:hypothetical protein